MIGVFDSGVGGLGVLTHIRRRLPTADLLYLADQARAPYGPRSLQELAVICEDVADWLIAQGAETVVIACNTASAAALKHLRERHPRIPFVGMEPAVKPAAMSTRSGVIGVVATSTTFQGELFASVVSRHAPDVEVLTAACPRWVELVEAGEVEGPGAEAMVEDCLRPLLEGGADTLVLGCTHFPFLRPLIDRVAGPGVEVVDPAPAVAEQVARVHVGADGRGALRLATSGSPSVLAERALQLAAISTNEPVLAWDPR